MDISVLDKSSIKIRFRHAVLVVDPQSQGPRVNYDGVILLNNKNLDLSKVVDYRVIINGPGEYEIGGVKATGIRTDSEFVYNIMGDRMEIVLGSAKNVLKIKEELTTKCQIAILNVDSEFMASKITGLEPKIVILYGSNKDAAAKILGKENPTLTKKFSIKKDKLPEEMEIIILG